MDCRELLNVLAFCPNEVSSGVAGTGSRNTGGTPVMAAPLLGIRSSTATWSTRAGAPGSAGDLAEHGRQGRRHVGQVVPVGRVHAHRYPGRLAADRRVRNRPVIGRIVQRGDDRAVGLRPGGAGQPDGRAGRGQAGHGETAAARRSRGPASAARGQAQGGQDDQR